MHVKKHVKRPKWPTMSQNMWENEWTKSSIVCCQDTSCRTHLFTFVGSNRKLPRCPEGSFLFQPLWTGMLPVPSQVEASVENALNSKETRKELHRIGMRCRKGSFIFILLISDGNSLKIELLDEASRRSPCLSTLSAFFGNLLVGDSNFVKGTCMCNSECRLMTHFFMLLQRDILQCLW